MNDTLRAVPRLVSINRQQLVLRSMDVEKLVDEDHCVRAIWELAGRLDLRRYHGVSEPTGDMSNEVGRVKGDSVRFLTLLQTPVPERSGTLCSEHFARVSVPFCAPT